MNQHLTDQEIITDVLSSQKFVTGNYNTVANEAKSGEVRDAFLSILREEHDMQFEVFSFPRCSPAGGTPLKTPSSKK